MDTLTLTLFDQLALDEREDLTHNFEKRHAEIERTNKLMISTIKDIRSRGWATHLAIWEPTLFLNTAAYDLSITLYDLVYEKNEWKRRLIARNLSTLLFESAEDLTAIFGKPFRESVAQLAVPYSLLNAFETEHKKLRVFWNNHAKMLKSIRTICGAHRDHDAVLMHETIESLDLLTMLRITIELGGLLNCIGPALQAIVTQASSVCPPELQRTSP